MKRKYKEPLMKPVELKTSHLICESNPDTDPVTSKVRKTNIQDLEETNMW